MPGPVTDEWWMLTIAHLADTEIHGDLPIHLTWDGRSPERHAASRQHRIGAG
jgi:hypothetical protein